MELVTSPNVIEVQKAKRQSGVELLKIVGIILIVLHHVVQALTTGNEEWVVNIPDGTSDPFVFILALLKYSGLLGNLIFFCCSAWFLLDKNKTNYQKTMRIILDVFTISVIWLIPVLIWKKNELGWRMIIRSFFPTYFENNWYITSYILFCFLSPAINLIIKHLSQKNHLIVSLTLFIAYFCLGFIYEFPWSGIPLYWITIYFVISYFKYYGMKFCKSKKANLVVLLCAILLHLSLILVSNLICLKFGKLGVMALSGNNNPLLFIIAFSSLNLMNMTKFFSRAINFLSSFSMLIYIIHENLLFRIYLRPLVWAYVYNNFGYSLLPLWIVAFTLALFISSFLIAVIYRFSLEKLIHIIADKILIIIKGIVKFISAKIINVLQ